MKFRFLVSSAAVALLLVGSAQATQLVTDGGFENVNTSLNDGGTITTYWQTGLLTYWTTPNTTTSFVYLPGTGNGKVCQGNVVPIASCGGGSTFQLWNNTVAGANGNAVSIPNSPNGGNFIVADGGYTYAEPISQTINGLVSGHQYSVTFYQAAGQQSNSGCAGGVYTPTNCTNEQWTVNLGGTFVNGGTSSAGFSGGQTQTSPLMVTPQDGFSPWEQETLTFTANTTGSELLSFLADGSPDGQPPIALLDGVSMYASPEPASFAIMGVGLIGLGLLRLRFKKR